MPEINGQKVGAIAYGLMGLTWRQNPPPIEQAIAAMKEALNQGANLWNGGEFYGTPEYNSMTVLRAYFEKYPEDADKVFLSMKGGAAVDSLKPDQSPEGVRRSLDNTLAQLRGTKKIDAFGFARRDPAVSMVTSFGVLKDEYVDKGKVGAISLSEVSAATIHEAVKVAKVAFVEAELSLWSTEVLENGVAAACAQYGLPLLAYSPIGSGFLTGQIKTIDDLPANDMRRHLTRLQPEHFDTNVSLVRQVEALAAKKGCTPAQLAIGWVLALGRRPGMPVIIPLPGASTADRVRENSTAVELSDEEMAEIDETLARFEVSGDRGTASIPRNT